MISSSIRITLILIAITKLSVSDAQDVAQAPVYEALFAQVDRLGLNRTHYVLDREARPRFGGADPEFRFPAEIATHAVENFGMVSVTFVDESDFMGLFDSGCQAGWASFHERYPDADRLVRVSQVVFNERADQAFVYLEVGRGCLDAEGANYYLEEQNRRWTITRQTTYWVA